MNNDVYRKLKMKALITEKAQTICCNNEFSKINYSLSPKL